MKTFFLFRIIQLFLFLTFVSPNSNSTKHNSKISILFFFFISCIIIFIIMAIIVYYYKNQNKNSQDELILNKKKKLFLFQNVLIPVKYNFFEFEKYGTKCTICLDKFGNSKNVCLTPCNHIFHHKCLRKYIFESKFSNCPLCKYDLFICLKKLSINYKCIKIPENALSLDNEEDSENNNYVNDIKIYDNNYNDEIDSKDNNISIKENNSHIVLKVNNKKKNKYFISNDSEDYFHNKQISEQIKDPRKDTIINEHKVIHLTEI